jgi:DNA-binding transcriptional LysR family regulator
MEFRDIEYFAVVAEHGNVRRASEILGLSPPALSKSLRRLEKEMRSRLVIRTPKGVELTSVGHALLARVSRIRLTLDEVAREAADLSQGKAGNLRIGTSPAVGEDVPAVYFNLSRDAPELSIQIVTTSNEVSVPMLLKGELDLIFNYIDFIPAAPHKNLGVERLYDDVVVVCASASHRLSRLKRVGMNDLAEERWTVSSPEFLNMQWLYKVFQDRGLPPPRAALETRSIHLRLQAIATSNLIGFIPRRLLRRALLELRVKELPVKELIWRRPVGIMYREGGYLSPAGKRFIMILKAAAKEIAAVTR